MVGEAFRQLIRIDLRYSYLIIAAMVAAGLLVNLFLPHGWTIWPLVVGVSIMLAIHEAADRNAQGVPPFQVYAFFLGAMLVWLAAIAILSSLNPVIVLAAIIAMSYYCLMGYFKDRENKKLVARRRAEQRCVHCGHPADYHLALCMHCGREPDPDDAQLKRVAHAPKTAAEKARARESLRPKPATADVARKEQALLDRRRTNRPR